MKPLNMFCPIKANKSKKSHQPNSRNSELNNLNSNNSNNSNANSSINGGPIGGGGGGGGGGIGSGGGGGGGAGGGGGGGGTQANSNQNYLHEPNPMTSQYKYVTEEFHAKVGDELTVFPGDVVIYNYSDTDSNGINWSNVTSLKTSKEGFVPSKILSSERIRPNLVCKKKLPRSLIDPIDHHHGHLHKSGHHHHHHHHHHPSAQPSSNGDTGTHQSPHRQHVASDHQVPSFGVPHSLQGSSSKQSFQKYPVNLRNFNTGPYCNLAISDPHCEQYETVFSPFRRDLHGLYLVTNNFVAREENDLSVKQGEYVTVLNKEDEDWYWVSRSDYREGFVPSRFICDYEQVISILNKGNSTVTMKSSNQNDCHTYINHGPDRESLATGQQSSVFQHV